MSITETKKVNPTTIITGFLGAGKTTYLNHILDEFPRTNFAIIENEYGEQSIDSELIMRPEDNIIELNNGCLCCTLNDNLYEILNDLYLKRNDFSELIIEATGVADPRGLAAPFLTNPAIKKQFPLRKVICLIDAALINQQLKESEEAIQQITFSDVLLINKTDLIDQLRTDKLIDKLKRLNPIAHILNGNQSNFPRIYHMSHDSILNNAIESVDNKFPVAKPTSHHHHHHHDHSDGLISHTLSFDQPFDHQKLHIQLLPFLMFQSKGLYRMKGLIWIKGKDEKYVLQTVGKQIALEPIKYWKSEKKHSKIVIIGKRLGKEGLQKMFEKCFADIN